MQILAQKGGDRKNENRYIRDDHGGRPRVDRPPSDGSGDLGNRPVRGCLNRQLLRPGGVMKDSL